MVTANKYPSEPLKLWKKAKELREQYYLNYARAKDKGGLRCAAAGWSFDAIPAAFGDDVYLLTGEPYGASIAHAPSLPSSAWTRRSPPVSRVTCAATCASTGGRCI